MTVIVETVAGFELEPVHSQKYTVQQIDSTLLLLAKLGSAVSTSEHVQQLGWDITPDTIRSWKTKQYPRRYAAQVATHRPELEAHMVQNASDAIAVQAGLAAKLADRLDANSDKIDARDLPAALKNTVTSWAITMDKYALATGRPTSRVETTSADDVIRSLEARGYVTRTTHDNDVIDTTETPPA